MHTFRHAILRTPAPTFAEGLTHARWDEPPSYPRMLEQHRAYASALREAGLELTILDALPDFPDAHFVEDVALVFPELAIVTRPGAPSRRAEAEHIGEALAAHRALAQLEDPAATVDGGDVLSVDRRVFVGLSARTNQAGVEALARLLGPHGYAVTGVEVPAGLHFKSSVNLIGPNLLVATPAFAKLEALADFELLELGPGEDAAANALWINDRVLVSASVPGFAERLAARGLAPVVLDMSEVEKMDGGLTCLSLRLS